MSWLVYAFAGPVLWAISTHFDKYLVERYFKHSNVAVLLLFTALTGFATMPVIGFFNPEALTLPLATCGLMTLAGVLTMAALYFYLWALQGEEASVVVPFSQASPLFGYILAFLILGEVLTPKQMLGGALIVIGALAISIDLRKGFRFKAKIAALMLGCAFASALSWLIFKAFAIRDDFWPTAFWMFFGQAAFGAGLFAIPSLRHEFVGMFRANPLPVLSINVANEAINLGGMLGSRYALVLAPLSLVQAVTGTTSIFVYAFGVIITLVCPHLGREDVSPRNLIQKGFAAIVVAIGVALVNSVK